MKQLIALLIVISSLPVSTNAQRDRNNNNDPRLKNSANLVEKQYYQTDAQKMNLKDKVKSIRELTYTVAEKNSNIVKDKMTINNSENILSNFDKYGNITTTIWYTSTGKIDQSWEYKYIKPGMMSEMTYFNSNHNLIGKTTYEYNEADYLVKEIQYDNTGKVEKVFIYNYTFLGRREYLMETVDNNGKTLNHKEKISYDKDTNVVLEEKLISGFGKLHAYVYDGKKQIITDNYQEKIIIKGDEDYHVFSVTSIQYDLRGNVILKNSDDVYYKSKRSTKFEYVYDSHSNYTSKSTFPMGDNGILVSNSKIIERKIEYY